VKKSKEGDDKKLPAAKEEAENESSTFPGTGNEKKKEKKEQNR